MVRLHDAGVRALFSLSVRPDDKKSDQEIANVDQGGLGLAGPRLLSEDRRALSGAAQAIRGAHSRAMFTLLEKARGIERRASEARSACRNGTGDGAGQGLHGSRDAAESGQCLSPDDGWRAGRADARFRLEAIPGHSGHSSRSIVERGRAGLHQSAERNHRRYQPGGPEDLSAVARSARGRGPVAARIRR